MATTSAKALAAVRNAQKSTGPKTEEGKRKSRMNALKHGLTAKTVLMPEEDPAEFEQHMVGWFDALKPQDKLEVSLVERGAYAYWQLDRANRSESARLWSKADHHTDDQANRVSKEVAALARRLLLPPGGNSPAFPCDQKTGDDSEGGFKNGGAIAFADHPREIVRELMTTVLGCECLLELWSELDLALDEEGWRMPERFREFRLMGIHPSDAYMTTEMASFIQACQAIDPGAGSLVNEIWNDCVPKDKWPELEAMYQRKLAYLPAIDRDGGRQYLREIITRRVDLIAEKAERHIERAKTEEQLAPLKLAFDDSPEGKLMRRYEHGCKQFFLRCLDEVNKHRKLMIEWSKQGIGGRYYRPTPAWFAELSKEIPADYLAQMETRDRERTARIEDGTRKAEEADEPDTNGARATSGSDEGIKAESTSESDIEHTFEAQQTSNLAETGLEISRTREVGDGACLGAGLTFNGVKMSNKERRRRIREERKRMRESVSC